jgi:hypothetical protein
MRSNRALALLERENPVDEDDLPPAHDPGARLLMERILMEEVPRSRARELTRPRLMGVSTAGVALALTTAVTAILLVGSPGGDPAVENAAAAVEKAAAVTAASAERSGTAVVRITHDDELWARSTIRWNGADLAVSSDAPRRPGRAGSELLLVDAILYGIDPEDGGGVVLGSPENIDPGSGTTPDEYLAATRDDVSGVTLRRLTDAMTGLTTSQLDDGSTVYSGSIPAGHIAREPGFKEGQTIRMLPFGYVAHGEAADPAAAVEAAVTVGPDGVIRVVTVTWGTGASAWMYEVAYSRLGTTPGLVAPAGARPLRDRSRAGE